MSRPLTMPQQRMLAEVRHSGKKVYNGRSRKTVEALLETGLVDVDWDMVAQSKGSGMQFVDRITVTPARCRWFHLCDNPATTTRRGPTPNGPDMFGEVPICGRCDDRLTRMESE